MLLFFLSKSTIMRGQKYNTTSIVLFIDIQIADIICVSDNEAGWKEVLLDNKAFHLKIDSHNISSKEVALRMFDTEIG